MMIVYTVTTFRSLNYGAVLQAYALHTAINSLGHDCKVLDFRPDETERKFHHVIQKAINPKEALLNVYSLIRFSESKRMLKAANYFFFNQMKLSKRYMSYDELTANPPQADAFICGSDQIWNPKIFGLEPRFFLAFVKDNKVRKASYAASIGISEMDEKYHERIRLYLDSFCAISVREHKAKEILANITDKPIRVMPDPSFLLKREQWQTILPKKRLSGKYILCYMLAVPDFLNEFLNNLKADTGCQIIAVSTQPYIKYTHDRLIRDIGPDGFVGLIASAEIVVTSSFHGTVFSMIFGKQFYSYAHPSRGSRITEILDWMGLSSRLINSGQHIIREKIDYLHIEKKLQQLREDGLMFLENVLK